MLLLSSLMIFVILVLTLDDVTPLSSPSSRRRWLRTVTIGSWTSCFIVAYDNFNPTTTSSSTTRIIPRLLHGVDAKTPPSTTAKNQNPLNRLVEAQDTLDTLLTNYQRATIDCTYADVPRELLESKNKALLLEKASTFALFDKTVSVETCRTTNRIVRDYLGVTGKGPLVGIEKQIKAGIDFVDPDDLGDFISELENFSQAYSKASSLSYTAGVADFDAVNNFSKDEAKEARNENSNIEQTKRAIEEAKSSLDRIISMLRQNQ